MGFTPDQTSLSDFGPEFEWYPGLGVNG
jgi:hypothetical protein